jgi:hypothetical protein
MRVDDPATRLVANAFPNQGSVIQDALISPKKEGGPIRAASC